MLAFGLYGKFMNLESKRQLYRVGIPGTWGTLDPALQHNAYGDSIFTNIYEPLTKTSEGRQLPRLAKAWEISNDFRVFKFHIDESHFFSDGTRVTSRDVKASWESGLKRNPISSNSSAIDVLGALRDFDKFKNSGTLTGVITPDDKTIELHFANSFRNALDELSTSRVAISKQGKDGLIGSGPFMVTASSDNSLRLEPNPYYFAKNLPAFEIKYVPPTDLKAALTNGSIDLALFAEKATGLFDAAGNTPENVDVVIGPENSQWCLSVNSMHGRFFSEVKRRLALQALVLRDFGKRIPKSYSRFVTVDPQTYFRIQLGRIDDKEASQLVSEGEPFISELLSSAKTNPLFVTTVIGQSWMIDYLKELGLNISQDSRELPNDIRLKMFYKTFEPDLFVGGYGLSQGDPDLLSHLLFKGGAINSPIFANAKTSPLLEEGRQLLDREKLNLHYQKVSKTLLKEVPYVHLGYNRTIIAYRRDNIQIPMKYRGNDEFSLLEFVESK